MKGRLLVCSDIHGQHDPFIQLLELAKFNRETDQLILCGDYVDRGPESRDVINQIIDLVENHGAIALKGNHDDFFIGNILHPNNYDYDLWMHNGGKATLNSYNDGIEMKRHAEWLSNHLRIYHETEDFIFVHAGVAPNIPINKQSRDDLLWIRYHGKCNLGKLVVHGHTPVHEITQLHDQLYIDTGSVFGNKLSMIELISGEIFEI